MASGSSSPGPLSGRGRLAELLATRGGRAEPEAPFVIEHREALIYMLCEAAELEHGIMCQYLFAAFSLKQRADEGLTPDELEPVTRWRRAIAHVATEEMLHLALVQNVLSAIGAAPHLTRPNLPAPAHHYPAGVNLTLVPFGERALQHFMFLERPEGMALEGAQGIDAPVHEAVPLMAEGDIVPQLQDLTVGHLYRSIEQGLARLAEKFGERHLFVGPPRAQATSTDFRWPELVAVTDLAASFCDGVAQSSPEDVASALGRAERALTGVADSLARHFADWGATSRFVTGGGEAAALSTEDEPMHFDEDVKPLFREHDRDSMRFAFDLWSIDDVASHADAILDRLEAGTMPCDGAWPADRVAVFRRWIDAGKPA